MRLQKYLADCGICSRRKAEEYILQGLVQVNGLVIEQLGVKVKEGDEILFHGRQVIKEQPLVYYMLHKPEGYVTTVADQFGRPTVMDLLKDVDQRVFPVGRLDYDTSGLLLITNDGALTFTLTHPKHNIDKTYIAKVQGVPTAAELAAFACGLTIEDYVTAPAQIKLESTEKGDAILRIAIHQGKNRQVRKMCAAIDHPVITLKRIAIGEIVMDDLKKGTYRQLTHKEIAYLTQTQDMTTNMNQ